MEIVSNSECGLIEAELQYGIVVSQGWPINYAELCRLAP